MKRTIKIAVSCLYYAVAGLLTLGARTMGRQPRPRLVILYYHSVPDSMRGSFARQMDMLRRRASVVRADSRGLEAADRCCAITFDDAFVSVIENALPELAVRELPCTIFVPAGKLGREPDWAMEGSLGKPETIIGAECLKALPSPLVTIGAHSVSHPFLSRISRSAARSEIELSRSMLTEMTGEDVRLLAFPYGDYDPEVATLCAAAGFEFVYSIEPKSVDLRTCCFVRGRVAVEPDDGRLEFFLKMSGAYRWMASVSRLKRLLMDRATGR